MSSCKVCGKEIPGSSTWRCDTCKTSVCSERCAILCHKAWTSVPVDTEPNSAMIASMIYYAVKNHVKKTNNSIRKREVEMIEHLISAYGSAIKAESEVWPPVDLEGESDV